MNKRRIASLWSGAILAGVVAAVSVTAVTGRAGASITAGAGPFHFGQSYATTDVVTAFDPKNGRNQPDGGYWAKIECSQAESLVYAQFADLEAPFVQSGFTFGPTPSWSGGAADCVVRLLGIDNGAFTEYAVSAGFGAVP